MTIEEILDCSADRLEAMSDQELIQHFSIYFKVTRPELAPKPNAIRHVDTAAEFKMKQNMQKLADIGIDLSGVLPKRKKR